MRYLALLMSWALAAPAVERPLTQWALELKRDFLARETQYAVSDGHQSVVRLKHDADGRLVKTRYAALVVSGLFNSPNSMRPFEAYFERLGCNVVNLRLAGHYEADSSVMMSGITWPTWKRQGERALALARELGHEVILLGHSTGGLLVTWLAAEDPRGVGGLALLAPAFGVHYVSGLLVSALNLISFGQRMPDGRFMTGHAAVQVRRMGQAFLAEMAGDGREPFAHVAERLRNVPVWMGNTAIDRVIDLELANQFFAALERAGGAPRAKELRPWCERILHDHLASTTNPHLPALLRSMAEVIPPKF